MSLFTCANPVETRNKFCLFENVSACGDHVSHLICNNHAALFGLKYRARSYCDGMNNTATRINTYIITNHNFNIPLFITADGRIMMNEIKTFCQNVQQLNAQQRDKFEQHVACLVGFNPYASTALCDIKGWLGDPTTRIVVFTNNAVPQQLTTPLPDLHKALFYYTRPSVTVAGPTQIYAITNVSLVGNETNTSFAFTLINPSNIFKLTNLPNSEATPLVLHAIAEITPKPETRTFTPINKTIVC